MNLIKHPTAIALLLLTTFVITPLAQQKRQTPAKPQAKPAAAPVPPPTFDTLVPADSYILYGEIRGVGQLIRSSTLTDFMEPILKLAGPPKEFRTIVRWLNTHADELMTSRLLVATWPMRKDVPDAIIAIEFASAEEAAKFAGPLNQFLPTVVPTPTPSPSPQPGSDKTKPTEVAKSSYHFQQAGSLLLFTPTPLNLKKLKPAGSKPITEDINFRSARNRFNSEPLFVFVDVRLMERQQEEQMKQYEQARKALPDDIDQQKQPAEPVVEPEITEEERARWEAEQRALAQPGVSGQTVLAIGTPDPVSMALTSLASGFFSGESDWPDGVGLALSFENDSFDLRALFVSQPGEKSDVIPFMPRLLPGPAFIPASPGIVPADTQVMVTMSLDLQQIYTAMAKPPPPTITHSRGRDNFQLTEQVVHESPFAAIEKKLQLNIKDDLLPLLGSEIAIRLPATGLNVIGVVRGVVPPTEAKEDPSHHTAPVLLISLKDKEAVRALMPRIVDAMGFKGASSLAQTERKEDTEIVSFVNVFSYAFVENFLVLSADPAAIRHVVDSYLKHETLASDAQFRIHTRWQPRPAQGQLYISPALMESYKTWAESPGTLVSDQARAFLTRLSTVPQPITYSLSNDGLGPLHELHLPKNLVLMAVAGISGEINPPPTLANERAAILTLYSITNAQFRYKQDKGNGSFGTLEQLIAEKIASKEMMDSSGYKIDMSVSGDKFEVSAVPVEYGKTGTRSFFIDQTMILRGGDRNGAPATGSDPQINN